MGKHLERGHALFEMGRYREAADAFNEELNENPESAQAFALRGLSLLNLGLIYKADEDVRNALLLDPNYSFAHYLMSFIWEQKGRKEWAYASIREALRLWHSADFLHRLGEMRFADSHYDNALELSEKALAINPRHESSLLLRAESLCKLGRVDEASDVLRSALSINPENADIHQGLSAVKSRRGEAVEAVNLLQEARRINPIYNNDRDKLAIAYGKLIWPFNRVDAARSRWRYMPPLKQWLGMAGIGSTLIAVLLLTGSSYNSYSVGAISTFVVIANLATFVIFYEQYGAVAARVKARRDLDLSWHTVVDRNLGVLAVAMFFHIIASIIGAVFAVLSPFMFFLLSILLGLHLLSRLVGSKRLLPWILVPMGVACLLPIAILGANGMPKEPATVLSYWAMVLLISALGCALLQSDTHFNQEITQEESHVCSS